MGRIVLKNVEKSYDGKEKVIQGVDLTIEDGSFTVFVGPSGSGKSTLLRMIAGLEDITDGEIYIDETLVNNIPARDRDIAMVFQNYALYPSMTVKENIEFGLKNIGMKKSERNELIDEVIDIVDLRPHLNKKPGKLSGGQRQRVALARAMVKKPKVFILDEPLSNLDAKLRVQMRSQLIELHKRLGTTFIYVTHDQVEAMSMGTHIVLLNFGKVMQYSTPKDIYYQPNNLFTATFMGTPPMNIVDINTLKMQTIEDIKIPESAERFGFRPEDVIISDDVVADGITLLGELKSSEMLGSETIHSFKIIDNKDRVFVNDVKNQDLQMLKNYNLTIPINKLKLFDSEDQRIVGDV